VHSEDEDQDNLRIANDLADKVVNMINDTGKDAIEVEKSRTL